MTRPTGRGLTLLGLAAGTYFAGRVLGTWELYFFAFAFLATVILSWLSVIATGRWIRVTRRLIPDRPTAGDEPELNIVIKNASILPGPQLTLRSPLAGLSVEDLELQVESLAPRRQRVVRTCIGRANRGVHILPAAMTIAEDPLGVARALHKVSDPLSVVVYPRIVSLDSCALLPDIGLKHNWSGERGLPSPGASEFRGIRPHQPGEPLSHIDWKSTAKTGNLMLREMEEPAGADITVLLDGTAAQLVGTTPDTNFELAVRAAGSIADFALRSGHGVSLLRHEHSLQQTRLTADGSGRRILLETLAEAQPTASAPLFNALHHLRTDGPHLLRVQSVTLVSMSLDQQLMRALIALRESGVRLAFLYTVGTSFAQAVKDAAPILPFLPPRDVTGSASHKDHLDPSLGSGLTAETRALLLSLSSAGIPCLTLNRGDDLARFLSRWQPDRQTRTAW